MLSTAIKSVVVKVAGTSKVLVEGRRYITVLSALYNAPLVSSTTKEVFPEASVKVSIFLELLNASLAMVVSVSGRVTVLSEGQLENVPISSSVIEASTRATESCAQLLKAFAPMLAIVLGITISTSDVLANALSPIEVTEAGKLNDCRPEPEKA